MDKDYRQNRYQRESELLGGTGAAQKLRKMLLFQAIGIVDCYRCKKPIETIEAFSIDHKSAWRAAPDPKASFFDLENIAFSHLSCNTADSSGPDFNRRKTHCPQGHEYTPDNVYGTRRRQCKKCTNDRATADRQTPKGKQYLKEYYQKNKAKWKARYQASKARV